METVNDQLLRLTAAMPMKQINLRKPIVRYDDGFDLPKLEYPFAPVSERLPEPTHYDEPYLQRYYAGRFRCGADLWLHRFLSGDGDRHLHSHPFEFSTVCLNSGYKEEFMNKGGTKETSLFIAKGFINNVIEDFLFDLQLGEDYAPQAFSFLAAARHYNTRDVFDWHRIAEVFPETWTAVIVKPQRLPKWYFKDDEGELIDMVASPIDWHKNYKPRPECGIAKDDNRKS